MKFESNENNLTDPKLEELIQKEFDLRNHIYSICNKLSNSIEEYCKENNIIDKDYITNLAYESVFHLTFCFLHSSMLSGTLKENVIDFAKGNFKGIIDAIKASKENS